MVRLYSPSRFIPDAPHGHAFSLNAHDNDLQPMPLEGGLEPAPAGGLRRVVLHHFSSFSCCSVSSLPTNPHCCGTHNFVDKHRSDTRLRWADLNVRFSRKRTFPKSGWMSYLPQRTFVPIRKRLPKEPLLIRCNSVCKRLANYIYPALSTAAMMMPPSSTDMLRVHHEFELI
jgi:hypothetical protein